MALVFDPVAREQLNEMRTTLGESYAAAIWAQRGFEQEIRNAAAIAHWRESFPAWDRLYGRPAMQLGPQPEAQSAQDSHSAIVLLPNGRAGDSRAA